MPITVELQDMFSYSFWLTAGMTVLVMLIGIIGLVVFLNRKNKKKAVAPKPAPVQGEQPQLKQVSGEQIKQKYCAMIDELENQYRGGKVSNRKAYQELSVIVRQFVYELTGVKVHNFTLDEINRLDMPSLYTLIAECYTPEFSVDKDGNIYDTMNKTRMVIKEWR